MRASPHCSQAGTQGGPHQSLKIVLSYVLILCALRQEVQLCLYCSLFAMGAQSVFLGQPGLSVPTHLYGQAVFTESVLCQRGSLSLSLSHSLSLSLSCVVSCCAFLLCCALSLSLSPPLSLSLSPSLSLVLPLPLPLSLFLS